MALHGLGCERRSIASTWEMCRWRIGSMAGGLAGRSRNLASTLFIAARELGSLGRLSRSARVVAQLIWASGWRR